MTLNSHWVYQGAPIEEAPENAFGFIYMITNTTTGKRYIGRKYLGSTRRVKRKGKTNRKVIRKESDWKEYTGSSKELLKDIDLIGKDSFVFEILCFGETKGQVNYLEENLQHKHNVLTSKLPNGERLYYNDSIGARKFMSVKFTDSILQYLQS